MATERLQQQIAAFGVANAIVTLRKESSAGLADTPPVTIDDTGRVQRTAVGLPFFVADQLQSLFHTGTASQSVALAAVSGTEAPVMLHLPYLGIVYGAIDAAGLQALEAHDAVDTVADAPQLSLIQPVTSTAVATPPSGPTWGLERLRVPKVWARGVTGSNIAVAHLDTGADSTHPQLASALTRTQIFDLKGQPVTVSGPYADTGTHGTHTAGTIAGRGGTGNPVIGVAPDADLYDGLVIEGGDAVGRVLAGMNWALQQGARVLSMSLGFRGWVDSFEAIMQTLRAQQLLPVIAIGNEGPQTSRSPGNYRTALSVGATDNFDDVAYFSGSQTPGGFAIGPVLSAPGYDVLSSVPGGGYASMNGTSMATPHVAGLAALLLSAKPQATIDAVQAALVASCTNPRNVDPVRIGAGIPDAVVALDRLLSQ